MTAIAGSHALLRNIPTAHRNPKDLDLFLPAGATVPSIQTGKRIEVQYFPRHIYKLFKTVDSHLNLKSLYVVKLSHSEYDVHWQKTVDDVALMRQALGIKSYQDLEPNYQELFLQLREHWKKIHGYRKKVSLNTSKDMFFAGRVKRKYDHDDLHAYVAYEAMPFYQKILKENQAVMIDEGKFRALTYEEQLKVCREEITVIGIERFVIPNFNFRGYREYYRKALKKVVVNMTKGWFPTFIVENYPELRQPDLHCFRKMKQFDVDFESFSIKMTA